MRQPYVARSTQRRLHLAFHLGAVSLLALLTATLGCAHAPVQAWQNELEHYVRQHAHGNPAALADLGDDPAQRRFDHIGERRGLIAPTRTDTHGVLVGHHVVDGEVWFIYLVAAVRNQGGLLDVNFDRPAVQRIEPVAFTLEPAKARFRWARGEAADGAMQRYLAQQRRRWAQSHPDRRADELRYTRFPRPWDRFELSADGRQVRIDHPATGASWSLALPGARD